MFTAASSPLHGIAVSFGAGFTGLGLLFVLVGLLIRRTSRPFKGGERAQGRIVGYETGPTAGMARVPGSRWRVGAYNPLGTTIIYRPRVVFTTHEGADVTATSRTGTNPRPGKVGDTVTVYYMPNDPQHVRVEAGRAQRTCLEVAFVLIGVVLAVIGIPILVSVH